VISSDIVKLIKFVKIKKRSKEPNSVGFKIREYKGIKIKEVLLETNEGIV
jgi:hypothetical protein